MDDEPADIVFSYATIKRVADLIATAFYEHDRVDHGNEDPEPIPLDCQLDVAARLLIATHDSLHEQPDDE